MLAEAQARKAKLDGMAVTITAQAGTEGKLFGSVGTTDIADAVTAAGVEVEKKEANTTDENEHNKLEEEKKNLIKKEEQLIYRKFRLSIYHAIYHLILRSNKKRHVN